MTMDAYRTNCGSTGCGSGGDVTLIGVDDEDYERSCLIGGGVDGRSAAFRRSIETAC